MGTDYAGTFTVSPVQTALDDLTHYHERAQRAAKDRLNALGAALAEGATQEQVQTAMDGLGIADALLRSF